MNNSINFLQKKKLIIIFKNAYIWKKLNIYWTVQQ